MKPNGDSIERVQQRARRYWYDDGLTEIAAGFIFVLIGLLFYIEASAPTGSLPANFSAIGLPILIIGGGAIVKSLVSVAKERLTYPRTGYIAYRRPQGTRRAITAILAMAIAVLIARLLVSLPVSLVLVPLLDGLVIGVFLLYLAHTLGLLRFYALAVISILVGTACALGGLGVTLGSAAYFGALGLALIATGALTLWTYILNTDRPAEE